MPFSNHNPSHSFSEHHEELHAYALKRLNCADKAADFVQETFLRMLRQPKAEAITQPRAYLYRIMINLICDHGRRCQANFQTVPSGLMADCNELTEEPSPAQALDSQEAHQRLQEAIHTLPKRCREVFELQRFHGMSHREIAEQLNISQSTIEKHIAAALVRLRHELQDLF